MQVHIFIVFFYIRSIEKGPFEEIKLLLDKKVFDVLLWLIALQFKGIITFEAHHGGLSV